MKFNHIIIIASMEASVGLYERIGFEVVNRQRKENDAQLFMMGNEITIEFLSTQFIRQRWTGLKR